MSVEISSDIFYELVNVDDIMLFTAKRWWNYPLIFYIRLQNVDGNLHRQLKCRWKFPSTFFLSTEDIDDILLLIAKGRWKISKIFYIHLQNVDRNFHRHFTSVSKSHH